MEFPLRPAALQQRMDDHAVLADRANTLDIARMHRDLALLYRERLCETLRMLLLA